MDKILLHIQCNIKVRFNLSDYSVNSDHSLLFLETLGIVDDTTLPYTVG